jgi:hypothetical protein
MTNRKIDWGSMKPMTEVEKEALMKQQYAFTALIIMTVMNAMFGIFMIYKIMPVWLGMSLSFFAMVIIAFKAQKDLLSEGETMSESPDQFRERRSNK